MDDEINQEIKGEVTEEVNEYGDQVTQWQPRKGVGAKIVALVVIGLMVLGLVAGVVMVFWG